MNKPSALPVLYSLRNCPYAIRARMAIYVSGQAVQLRDIALSDKPAHMLQVSPKGTVPVLMLQNDKVLEQSLEIMMWAFGQSDPNNYLMSHCPNSRAEMLRLVDLFDTEFKLCLEKYRSAKRYHDESVLAHRLACEHYLQVLEQKLSQHPYLMSDNPSLADLAIVPFIRQLARVERQWYLQSPYPNIRAWLNGYLQSLMFSKVMTKYSLWLAEESLIVFSADMPVS